MAEVEVIGDDISANPSFDVVKTASPSTDVGVGDLITYTYVVTNTGDQAWYCQTPTRDPALPQFQPVKR